MFYGVAYERIDRFWVFKRDRWHCMVCGVATPLELLGTRDRFAPELDHRVPMVLGGTHTYENVQLACRTCNTKKGGHTIVGQLTLFPRPATGVPREGGEAELSEA